MVRDQELLLLGLLMERPKHGYDIKCQIKDELAPFIGVDINSIYYPLRKMEQEGLIKQKVGKEGNWPEKNVYSITPKGKMRFRQLVTRSFSSLERPYFHINLSLYFLRYITPREAKRRLKTRIGLLEKVRDHLTGLLQGDQSNSGALRMIVKHDLDLCNAEILSITRLAESL